MVTSHTSSDDPHRRWARRERGSTRLAPNGAPMHGPRKILRMICTALTGIALSSCATEDYIDKHVAIVQGQVDGINGRIDQINNNILTSEAEILITQINIILTSHKSLKTTPDQYAKYEAGLGLSDSQKLVDQRLRFLKFINSKIGY